MGQPSKARTSSITSSHLAALMRPGDIVMIGGMQGGRARRLAALFTRPRAMVVASVSGSTIQIEERRMTWWQWRHAVWDTLRHGA